MLMVWQMRGEYAIKHPNLIPLYLEAQKAAQNLIVNYYHVTRDNPGITLADELLNKVLNN